MTMRSGRTSEHKLERLFYLQRELMKRLDIPQDEGDPLVQNSYVLAACMGLSSEAGEVLQEVNVFSRPWARKPQEEVFARLSREAIDILFYFIELMILMGLDTEDVVALYEEKFAINMKRIENKRREAESK